jgi:hypothetical protein
MKEWDVMDNYIEKWVNVIEGMYISNSFNLTCKRVFFEYIDNFI